MAKNSAATAAARESRLARQGRCVIEAEAKPAGRGRPAPEGLIPSTTKNSAAQAAARASLLARQGQCAIEAEAKPAGRGRPAPEGLT